METIEVVVEPLNNVVMDLRARSWCKLPYPNHPRGCPNHGKKAGCPPKAPIFTDVAKPPFILVGVKFNLAEWAERMKQKHPKWSDRQARCCLYWQGKVRKRLREVCKGVAWVFGRNMIVSVPEAMGVHVFETCKTIGIELERNPKTYVWKIAILGDRK